MDDLSAALGRVPSGLYIVTAVHRGRRLGMVASWIMQADFSPPLLTIALQKDRPIAAALEAGADCAVNILPTGAKKLLVRFGNAENDDEEDLFEGLSLLDSDGPPILAEAHAYLRGRQRSAIDAGDHRVHLIEVESGKVLHPGEPMVHVRRSGMNY